MPEFKEKSVLIEISRKVEFNNSQEVLMRISRTGNPGEYIDVLLKAIRQSDSSWQLLSEYNDQKQKIQLSKDNEHGEISAEDSICRRIQVPYINLSPILPENWHETREVFHQYKGAELLLLPRNDLNLFSSVPNITFIKLESKQQ